SVTSARKRPSQRTRSEGCFAVSANRRYALRRSARSSRWRRTRSSPPRVAARGAGGVVLAGGGGREPLEAHAFEPTARRRGVAALEIDRRELHARAVGRRPAALHALDIAALRLVVATRAAREVAERERRVRCEHAVRVAGEEALVGRARLGRIFRARRLGGGVGRSLLARRPRSGPTRATHE